jgi:hypothetical protein
MARLQLQRLLLRRLLKFLQLVVLLHLPLREALKLQLAHLKLV